LKKLLLLLTILCCFGLFVPCTYADITIDQLLKDPNIDQRTRESIVQAIKKQTENETIVNIERVNEYVKFGEAFAESLQKVCKVLNVEVNDFVKTPVGKFTAICIAYKIFAKDFLSITIRFFLVTFIIIFYIGFIILLKYKKEKILDRERTEYNGKNENTKIKEQYIVYQRPFEMDEDVRSVVFIIASIIAILVPTIILVTAI